MGMIVGCIATLRPLFRRVLNLGGDSIPERTPRDHHTIWPTSGSRYGGRDEEWVVLREVNDAKAKRSSIQLPDSASEEQILGNNIKIARDIHITYTDQDEKQ